MANESKLQRNDLVEITRGVNAGKVARVTEAPRRGRLGVKVDGETYPYSLAVTSVRPVKP